MYRELKSWLHQYIVILGADYVDKYDTPRGFPGTKPKVPPANQVAQTVFRTERKNKKGNDLTTLFMTFGQFLDHDLTFSPHADCKTKE